MRRAALVACLVQLVYGLLIVAPGIFGMGSFNAPSQVAFRSLMVIGCLVLAIFFMGILTTPAPNVGGGVRIASVVAAAALIVENLPSALGTIRAATAAASECWLWRYHPLKQFANVLGLAIPALAGVSLVVFLVAVFARTLEAQDRKQDMKDRQGLLKLASFTVAAVFVLALFGACYAAILAPRPPAVPLVRFLLRFATLASSLAFFFVFGVNQRRHEM
jgi:hypothetical protein